MKELIKLTEYPVKDILDKLLQDKSTKENIVFATDTYRFFGTGYSEYSYMTVQAIRGFASCNIQPRVYKSSNEQNERTRKKAEVFTPSWVVNKMNNFCDAEWLGCENVFNREIGDSWEVAAKPVKFPAKRNWQDYVDSRRLEIACGEAPYITSRYDSTTGEIIDIDSRIGILDRKLRVVGENTDNEKDWLRWAVRAVESVYGYEFQGDNLLIARINVLSTFCDYLENKWHRQATKTELCTVANIIAWNFWQMDGLNGIAPFGTEHEEWFQFSLVEKPAEKEEIKCTVYDWRAKRPVPFERLKERGKGMKFDFVIGNPPYQDESNIVNEVLSENKRNFAPPIYNLFLEEAYKVGNVVELIHPARFLFNAGSTPKAWNEKMLADEHLKVVFYEPDSNKVFPGLSTPIKGGIAVTYRNLNSNFGSIGAFSQFKELNTIIQKVKTKKDFVSLCDIVYSRTLYRLTDVMHKENPNALSKLSKGHPYDMSSNIFELLPDIFYNSKPDDDCDYIRIIGRENNQRVYKFIKQSYINKVENMNSYKVMIPQATGSGVFGETFSKPFVEGPGTGSTETFISIGNFTTEKEANCLQKFIQTKFARALLGVLKVTQNGNKPVWKLIPLQDFSENSDIDWCKSISEIDKQLYTKYGLTQTEIDFIETHVKEME